jgi:alkyl hydroperoxide reductase subunit AhpC
MTVQELINELQKVENKELEVIVQTTDPTDWTYNNGVEFVCVDTISSEFDEDDTEVFVINGGDV